MAIIKWGLIVIGCLTLLVLGAGFGAAHYFKATPALQMSMADLQNGGLVLPGEHDDFLAACQAGFDKSFGAKTPRVCACIATRAEQSMSRLGRLTLTAGLNKDVSRLIAIGKGMAAAGASKEAIDGAAERQKAELKPMMAQCLGAG